MNRKILFGALGAALLLTAGPAHAGAGGIAQAREEHGGGNRGGGDHGGGRDFGQRGGGQNNGGGQRQWQSGGDSNRGAGGQRGQWQGRQAPQAQAPQAQTQRQGGDRWAQGGNNGAGARSGDRGQWRGQAQQPQQVQPSFRNGGQNDGRWANNGNRGNDGARAFNNNRGGDNRNFTGNNRAWDNRGWSGNNGNRGGEYRYRDNRERRSYAAIPYGRFFGPSYGSIVSRYYGRNYVYYGSRAWSSWDRPYRVGYLLPPSLYCSEVPDDLYYDLPPPPYGYDYALCGRDILLIGLDSRLVIDAIVGW